VTLTRKDALATVLTVLVVLAYLATHEGWDVWLIGDSHRWAAAAITLLGAMTCGQGSSDEPAQHKFSAFLGVLALILAVLALATGSLTPLSLLVADIVVLWAVSTLGHARSVPRRPVTS
jgi:hypothetical protein